LHVEEFAIAERFRGPPRSGNGGYVCGRLAAHIPGTAAVRLKVPPPLAARLRLESEADYARLRHGERLIGEARASHVHIEVPAPPDLAAAEAASRGYLGFREHSFPGCFVCGPDRTPGDGLRIFPGPVADGPQVAAPWLPDASLADASRRIRREFLWSALDCTGAFAIMPEASELAVVLGELAASFHGPLEPGEPCIATGWSLGIEGRKRYAGSAVHTTAGRLVALARAIWIAVPKSAWA
jgi:hypothetical protein